MFYKSKVNSIFTNFFIKYIITVDKKTTIKDISKEIDYYWRLFYG